MYTNQISDIPFQYHRKQKAELDPGASMLIYCYKMLFPCNANKKKSKDENGEKERRKEEKEKVSTTATVGRFHDVVWFSLSTGSKASNASVIFALKWGFLIDLEFLNRVIKKNTKVSHLGLCGLGGGLLHVC